MPALVTYDPSVRYRLSKILHQRGNHVCADCPSKNPQWASLLLASSSSDEWEGLGVLVCDNCALHHHFELGEGRTRIKYTAYYHEFSSEELDLLEQSGGNECVNALYEATLVSADFCKRRVFEVKEEEDARRGKFVKYKYKRCRFRDEAAWEAATQNISFPSKAATATPTVHKKERRSSNVSSGTSVTSASTASSRGSLSSNGTSMRFAGWKNKRDCLKSLKSKSAGNLNSQSASMGASKSRRNYAYDTMDCSSMASTITGTSWSTNNCEARCTEELNLMVSIEELEVSFQTKEEEGDNVPFRDWHAKPTPKKSSNKDSNHSASPAGKGILTMMSPLRKGRKKGVEAANQGTSPPTIQLPQAA